MCSGTLKPGNNTRFGSGKIGMIVGSSATFGSAPDGRLGPQRSGVKQTVAQIRSPRAFAMFQPIRETQTTTTMEARLFIAGRYADATKAARFGDMEPSTERELTQVASAGADDVDRAVAAAREAADRGPWPRMSAEARAGILNKLADGIEKRARDLGTLEARD